MKLYCQVFVLNVQFISWRSSFDLLKTPFGHLSQPIWGLNCFSYNPQKLCICFARPFPDHVYYSMTNTFACLLHVFTKFTFVNNLVKTCIYMGFILYSSLEQFFNCKFFAFSDIRIFDIFFQRHAKISMVAFINLSYKFFG